MGGNGGIGIDIVDNWGEEEGGVKHPVKTTSNASVPKNFCMSFKLLFPLKYTGAKPAV
jgi:hypothetical protein